MPRTDSAHSSPLMHRLRSWLAGRHTAAREIAALPEGEVIRLARDLGVTAADLTTIVTRGTDNRPLMEQMMRAHGLDPQGLSASAPAVVRDLERACAGCRSSARCRRDLRSGRAAGRAASYCANAAAFDALSTPAGQGRPAR